MRISRPRQVMALAGFLLLAFGGTAIAAPSDVDPPPPVRVSGTGECVAVGDPMGWYDETGLERVRTLVSRCTVAMSDERLPETYILIHDNDCHPDGACATWGTIEGEGPDGWRGTYRGWQDADGEAHMTGALVGFGDHAGLTFVFGAVGRYPQAGTSEFEGFIYAGLPACEDVCEGLGS